MPMVGLIDPSHSEQRKQKYGRRPRWLPTDELLEGAIGWDLKHSNWLFELVNIIIEHEGWSRDSVSTSRLTAACPRSEIIKAREPYIDDLRDHWKAIRGTLVHRSMEHASRPGSLAEWRFFTTLPNDIKVSCAPDLVVYDGPEPAIIDWKVSDNPPAYQYPYRNHTEQVQMNRYIVNHAERWRASDRDAAAAVLAGTEADQIPFNPREVKFKRLALVYMTPKSPKILEVEHTVDRTAPNGNKFRGKVPHVWTDQEVEEEFMPRAAMLRQALDAYPEWPEGAEKLWGGGEGWKCPGPPICFLPNCLAKRWSESKEGLVWAQPEK